MIHNIQSAQISQKQDGHSIYVIMKMMWPPRSHNGFAWQLMYLDCWALFGSLVLAMCNRTSCSKGHELPQNHCGDNLEGTLFSWLYMYYVHFAYLKFEQSVLWITYDHLYYAPFLNCILLKAKVKLCSSN